MPQFARQDSFVELVEVHELDQVGELGVPVVKAEVDLPVILALWGHENTHHVSGRPSGNAAARVWGHRKAWLVRAAAESASPAPRVFGGYFLSRWGMGGTPRSLPQRTTFLTPG